ncbi:MAG: hypothetical protein QMD97_04410 [Candidatus Aenigmarchaeota archaeon]|nr:hypothetical protein [Candidatus Aenigmarchaeota archaeon]
MMRKVEIALKRVMSRGFDPHQFPKYGKPRVDQISDPAYNNVRHAVAEKLRELGIENYSLSQSSTEYRLTDDIISTVHPNSHDRIVIPFVSERVEKRGPFGIFKRTVEVPAEQKRDVLRPVNDLLRELESY